MTALDLTSTLQGRLKPSPSELLATPADLDRWLVSSGLVGSPPGASESDLERARRLREAIFRLAKDVGTGSFDPEALAVLNRCASEPAAAPVLRCEGKTELEGSASGLLSLIAREAVYLFGGPTAARLHQCEAPTCTVLFLDTSRSGDRRWCSMSACGNRFKVAEHRKRNRSEAARPG